MAVSKSHVKWTTTRLAISGDCSDESSAGLTAGLFGHGEPCNVQSRHKLGGVNRHRLATYASETRGNFSTGRVCKACATKMGVLDDVKREGLTLLSEMSGHPGMARYRDDGFEIVTF